MWADENFVMNKCAFRASAITEVLMATNDITKASDFIRTLARQTCVVSNLRLGRRAMDGWTDAMGIIMVDWIEVLKRGSKGWREVPV